MKMLSTLFSLLLICTTSAAQATDLMIISFGLDGSTNRSFPDNNSFSNAQEVFKKIGTVEIENADYSILVDSKGVSVTFDQSKSHVVTSDVKKPGVATVTRMDYGNIVVGGKVSKRFYDLLRNADLGAPSGAIKVANISCVSGQGLEEATCSFSTVGFWSISVLRS